jgi:hypothetical protein
MKVLPIISNYPTNRYSHVKAQNFKGLWGPKSESVYEDSMYDIRTVTKPYYPFKDESKDDIDWMVQFHSSCENSSADSYKIPDPVEFTRSEVVSVCERLPFTEQEFKAYISNSLNDLRKLVIERCIMEKHLHG